MELVIDMVYKSGRNNDEHDYQILHCSTRIIMCSYSITAISSSSVQAGTIHAILPTRGGHIAVTMWK